jgi:pyruvate carboxylase
VSGPFESGQQLDSADVNHHKMLGEQFTNLLFQSTQLVLVGH